MPKKKTAFEMLTALPNDRALQIAGDLNTLSSIAAKRLASEIVLLADVANKGSEKLIENNAESAIAQLLEDELCIFAIKASQVLAKSESMRSRVLADSGRASAAKRSPSSVKAEFLAWVDKDTELNPRATASSTVERFISGHPEVKMSFETGLRYLRSRSEGK